MLDLRSSLEVYDIIVGKRSCWDLDWLFKASQITKRSVTSII